MSNNVTAALERHLRSAEADGRLLSDAEVSIIEEVRIASAEPAPEPPAQVNPLAGVLASDPERGLFASADLEAFTDALHQRRSGYITAAAVQYGTRRTDAPQINELTRFPQIVVDLGGVIGQGVARTIDVPKIASGDAAVWGGAGTSKAEIVTALSSIASVVAAAYTEITEPSRWDILGVDQLLTRLLARRVTSVESGSAADGIFTQGTSGGTGLTGGLATVAAAVATATTPNLIVMSAEVAASVLTNTSAGFSTWGDRRTLYGLPYVVSRKMTAKRAAAVDCRALYVSDSGLQAAVLPNNVVQNSVVVRVESSTAAVLLDSAACGTATMA